MPGGWDPAANVLCNRPGYPVSHHMQPIIQMPGAPALFVVAHAVYELLTGMTVFCQKYFIVIEFA